MTTISSTMGPDLAGINSGLLIARLVLGMAMAGHGAQKLFGWFGGHGLAGTGESFEAIGFRPGRLFAAAAGLAELMGGLLVAVGLLGPVGPALIISPMLVAGLTVHRGNGFFATGNGIELPMLYAVGALALALTGFGSLSLDALLDLSRLASPTLALVALALGVLGGLASLALRRPLAQPAS